MNDTTTTSNKYLGSHENDLFAKWRAARRDKLRRIAIAEQQREAAEHVRRTQ